MAEMYVGRNKKVPVKNLKSQHWGDIKGLISNQSDLQEALDEKLDKVSSANVLYGTDGNGDQTTYDLSSMFPIETPPDGYTEVEYITSTREYTEYTYDENVHSSLGTMTVTHLENFETKMHNQLSQRSSSAGYEITKAKFELHLDGSTGPWWVYFNDQNDDWSQAYTLTDTSLGTMFGLRFDYAGPNQGVDGDCAEITEVPNEHLGGQYIDTGIVIENFPYGHGALNTELSHWENTSLHPSWSPTYAQQTQNTINNMRSRTGQNIDAIILSCEEANKLTVYAATDTTSRSYGNYLDTNACLNGCGIYINFDYLTVGDSIRFQYIEPQADTYGFESSILLSDYLLIQSSGSYCLFGSYEQSGNAGMGLKAAINDGKYFLHFTVNLNSLNVPCVKKDWNLVKIEPGTFELNGEQFSISTASTIRNAVGTNVVLFGASSEPGILTSPISMKKTKIYKNGQLVFNGIPCIQDASGIAGMYDLVSNTFKPSDREGVNFIAGPVIETRKVNLGIDDANVLLGLSNSGGISAYKGKNGIIVHGCVENDNYEELEYIESTDGKLAFNTQRYWGNDTDNTQWEVTYYQTATSSPSGCQYVLGDNCWFDMGQSFYRTDFRMFWGKGAFCYSTEGGGQTGASSSDGIWDEELNKWHTFRFTRTALYLDNEVVKTLNPNISSVGHANPYYIFNAPNAYTYSTEFDNGFIGRISSVRMIVKRNATENMIYADFIPVRRKSDGEIGFYDKVGGIFCQNVGEGVPVAGPLQTSYVALSVDVDRFLTNIAQNKKKSLMITTPTLPSSSTEKDLSGSDNLVIGPYGETTGTTNSVAINGKVQGSNSVAIGKDTSVTGSRAIGIGINDKSYTTYNVGNDCVVIGYKAGCIGNPYNTVIGSYAVGNAGSNQVAIGYYANAVGGYCTAVGARSNTNNNWATAVGGYASASNNAVAIGCITEGDTSKNTVAGEKSVAIGNNAKANVVESVVIGTGAKADYNCSVALGARAETSAPYGTSIGTYASAGSGSIAIGYSTQANGENSISIGYTIETTGKNAISLGNSASATDTYSVAVGYNTLVDGECGVAIGYKAKDTTGHNVAIGRQAEASDNNAVAIGSNAKSTGGGGVAIGESASAVNRSIAIGSGAGNVVDTGIALGHISKTEDMYALALGYNSNAKNLRSTAVGYNAKATANDAIQLGEGTNSTASTLQFRNYPLVISNGIIPYERLTPYAPTDGYVLAWSTSTNSLVWVENGEGGGSYVLPIASATTLGGIKVGNGLQINPSTGVLSVTGGTGGGDGVWGSITGDINDQTDLKEVLDSKFEQVSSMPAGSSENTGKIYQYIGLTDILYTHGYVYECQYKQVSSLTGSTSDDSRFGVSFEARRFEEYFHRYHPEVDLTDTSDYGLIYDSSINKWTFLADGSSYDPAIEFDTANLGYLGIYLDYFGANEPEMDDEVYMEYIPSSDEQHAPFGYEWNRLDVQPNHDIIDNVGSLSTTDGLSANQGRILSERIDALSSIGQFLAIWDCNKTTNNARYLSDGYVYERGNYFIIGEVEEPNYDPEQGPVTVSFSTDMSISIQSGEHRTISNNETRFINRYNPTTDLTVRYTWNTSRNQWYDPEKRTYINAGSMLNAIGMAPAYPSGYSKSGEIQAEDLVSGDYFEVQYTHCHNYKPVGSVYSTSSGCERTYEDVQVSDMYFYDGENWVLLANHGRQIAVDSEMSSVSANPVENRVITNALDEKVNKLSDNNKLYGTTSLGATGAITVGEGLQLSDGTLTNTLDISGKQDTLVSGENIKTINGESLLGSGNIVIQGGGGEGMGTLNISNVFHRAHDVIPEEYEVDDRDDTYKGGWRNILFTTNADLNYLQENREDIYVTYARRNTGNAGFRKYRVLNDRRIKSDVKLYCWRWRTNHYWDSRFNTFIEDSNNWDNYASDLNYEYFYTLSDYNDDLYDMYTDNPTIFISDVRRQGSPKDDDNFSMGNWGTCFNEMYEYGNLQDKYDDQYEALDEARLERCRKYDVDEMVIDTHDFKEDFDEGDQFIIKMVGQSYMKDGEKYYLWSHEWWNEGSIYACLDGDDNPIPNLVPEDKSRIQYLCEFSDLEADGYTLIEKRPDLTYWKFNEEVTDSNKTRFINHCREITTNACAQSDNMNCNVLSGESIFSIQWYDTYTFKNYNDNGEGEYMLTYEQSEGQWYFDYNGSYYTPEENHDYDDGRHFVIMGIYYELADGYSEPEDGTEIKIYFEKRDDRCHRVYFWDYPINPVRLGQCKVLFTSLPPFEPGYYDPETEATVYPQDYYTQFLYHAYTFEEIENNPDLSHMLQYQKEIIFVYPYDTHYLWMRTFGLTKMVYQHEYVDVQQYQWYWDGDQPQWEYDQETGEKIPEDYRLYAEPWDRHNIRRGLLLGGQRNLGNSYLDWGECKGLGDFDNKMGKLQGETREPRINLGRQALYFLPVALNINKASEVFYNTDGKSTPFYFKLSITGGGNQKILAGQ